MPTFLAHEWANLFDMRFGMGWRNELLNEEYWERIDEIPDHSFWSLRQSLKSELLDRVRRRVVAASSGATAAAKRMIDRMTRLLEPA